MSLEGYEDLIGNMSLKGIVKLEKDENGQVGLEIPDCLKINNLWEGEEATKNNLLIEYSDADTLYKDPILELIEDGEVELTIKGQTSTSPAYKEKDRPVRYALADGMLLIQAPDILLYSKDQKLVYEMDGAQNEEEIDFIFGINSKIPVIPKSVSVIYNSFNDMPSLGEIDIHDLEISTFSLLTPSEQIQSCFQGTTTGTVLVSEDQFTFMNDQNLITTDTSGKSHLTHNTKVEVKVVS